MKTSNILLITAGYFSAVWYILSLSNAFRGTNMIDNFSIIHAVGAIIFFIIAAVHVWAEESHHEIQSN